MIPNTASVTHHIGEVEESIRMSIDQDSVAHLMAVLTDLYSDPILAVIREYSTNALDAHLEAGNKAPIRVKLPSSYQLMFEVEDKGVGLSVSDLRDVYSMYGRSTKRDSEEATGMLGLGCKSGLTYALSFTVVAIKEGVKTVASVTKDTDGVGTVKVIDTSATDLPNGVTISIPVKSQDVNSFTTKAKEFYKWWKPGTVLVDGKEPEQVPDLVWIDDDVAVMVNGGSDRIVMGNVAYPVNFRDHRPKDVDALHHSIIAWVPMGSVNFTPSREQLHYTTKTKETIATLLRYVHKMLPLTLDKLLNKAASPYDQLILAQRWRYSHAVRSVMQKYGDHLKLGQYTNRAGEVAKVSAWEVGRSWNNRARRLDHVTFDQIVRANNTLVTNFPFKSCSGVVKDRISMLGLTNAYLIPDTADLAPLKGHPRLMEWDDVVAKTSSVTVAATTKIKTKTFYTARHKGSTVVEEKFTGTDPIVYYNKAGFETAEAERHGIVFPDVYFVALYERQWNRFLEKHPTAVRFSEWRKGKLEEARKKLSEFELLRAGLQTRRWDNLKSRRADILDPDIRKLIDAAALFDKSPSPERKAFEMLDGRLENHPLHAAIEKQYPILGSMNSYGITHTTMDDIVLYVNAKYALTHRTTKKEK